VYVQNIADDLFANCNEATERERERERTRELEIVKIDGSILFTARRAPPSKITDTKSGAQVQSKVVK
jgi:hypothetical protein